MTVYVTLEQTTRRKEEASSYVDDSKFDWQEHERLESARLFSGASSCSNSSRNNSNSRNYNVNMAETSARFSPKTSLKPDHERPNHSMDSAAEEMLKKCYKTDDVSDKLKEMNFTDPSLDSCERKDTKYGSKERGSARKEDSRSDTNETGAVGGVDVEKFIQWVERYFSCASYIFKLRCLSWA